MFSQVLVGVAALSLVARPASTAPGNAPDGPAIDGERYGTYVMLLTNVQGGFDDIVTALRDGVAASDWELLADYAAGVDEDDCAFRSHVFVLHVAWYAELVAAQGTDVPPFALPLRMAVFQDEQGTHIAAANPLSLNRTIVAETGFGEASQRAVDALTELVGGAVTGTPASRQYGQMRERGLIGRTMGLIAGGPFPDKIERIESVRGESLADVTQRLYAGLEQLGGTRRWGLRPIYRLDLSDHGFAIIGVTGEPMEAKAFQIVRHGGDDARKDMACPGLDHAPAFPIELVLMREDERVNVFLVDAMFRMKMFFEDAGKMKFAANMRMPGSIEDEIRDKVEESLAN